MPSCNSFCIHVPHYDMLMQVTMDNQPGKFNTDLNVLVVCIYQTLFHTTLFPNWYSMTE